MIKINLTLCKIPTHLIHLFYHDSDILLLRSQLGLAFCQLRLQLHIVIMLDDQWRVTDNRPEEFLLGDLLDVGKA